MGGAFHLTTPPRVFLPSQSMVATCCLNLVLWICFTQLQPTRLEYVLCELLANFNFHCLGRLGDHSLQSIRRQDDVPVIGPEAMERQFEE